MGKTSPACNNRLRFVPPFRRRRSEESRQRLNSAKSALTRDCYDQVPGDDLVGCSQASWTTAAADRSGGHGNARQKAAKACRRAGGVPGRTGAPRDDKWRHLPFLRAMERVSAELTALCLRQLFLQSDTGKQHRKNLSTPYLRDVRENTLTPGGKGKAKA